MAELTEAAAVRRLHERLGFGLGGSGLDAAQQQGFEPAVARLLGPPTAPDAGAAQTPPPDLSDWPRPGKVAGQRPPKAELKAWRLEMKQQLGRLSLWWLDRMVAVEQPATERLTWFWHGHFATSAKKVKAAGLMLTQNQTFRAHALGSFSSLAHAMITDPALLLWLDGNRNTKTAPNENLSREFLELFSLGHGNYSEDDVREAARALTGWKIDRDTGTAVPRPRQHDNGAKQILGTEASYDADSLVTLLLDQPAAARFVVARLWFRLVSATPPDPATVNRLTAAYGAGRDIGALLAAISKETAFRDKGSALVKQPVEWAVGLMRDLGVRPSQLPEHQQKKLATTLRGMGQLPFLPPSVGGWPAGGAWLTTAAALSRVEAARLLSQAASLPPELSRTATRNRPELLRSLLGVDRFSARTRDAIAAVADRPPLAVAVAACSPEYTVSA
jgi:uncharacterized protein (DUF1800 family)